MSRPSPLPTPAEGGPLQGFDPRLRILTAAAFVLACLNLHRPGPLALALLLALAAALAAGHRPLRLLRRLWLMEGFMVVVLLLMPFSLAGEPLFSLAGHAASREGVWRAVTLVLRTHAVIFALLGLVGGIEVVRLGHALAHLRLPDKLVHLFLFTVRYIHVLYDEYLRLRRAMRCRGFVARSDRHSWNSLGWLIGMLLVRSLERAERIHQAMKCRGFQGRFYLLDDLRWRPRDSLAAALLFPLIAALPLLEPLI